MLSSLNRIFQLHLSSYHIGIFQYQQIQYQFLHCIHSSNHPNLYTCRDNPELNCQHIQRILLRHNPHQSHLKMQLKLAHILFCICIFKIQPSIFYQHQGMYKEESLQPKQNNLNITCKKIIQLNQSINLQGILSTHLRIQYPLYLRKYLLGMQLVRKLYLGNSNLSDTYSLFEVFDREELLKLYFQDKYNLVCMEDNFRFPLQNNIQHHILHILLLSLHYQGHCFHRIQKDKLFQKQIQQDSMYHFGILSINLNLKMGNRKLLDIRDSLLTHKGSNDQFSIEKALLTHQDSKFHSSKELD